MGKRNVSANGSVENGGQGPNKEVYRGFKPQNYRRVGVEGGIVNKTLGAISLLFLWGTWLGGCMSPFVVLGPLLSGYYKTVGFCVAFMSYPFIFKVNQSPLFARFVMNANWWFDGGNALLMEESMTNIDCEGKLFLCVSPHGVYSYGFFLNGPRARISTGRPDIYSPPAFSNPHHKGVGLVEPMLYKIPLIRHFMLAMGTAAPATKKVMTGIMSSKKPLGLLPGGSEEILIAEAGKERVYIKKRKGFIKYALKYGYTIAIGYTFGESDSYRCMPWFIKQRMWLWKRYKFLMFFPWGCWFCPLLPRQKIRLETVVGNPFELPQIDEPTQEDIDKWHQIYIEKLVDLFERNKEKFGYGDRTLELW